MSKRTRRLEARVEVLEREVERLRELMAVPAPPYITPEQADPYRVWTDGEGTGKAPSVWRIEGQDVYCEGDATCS